MSEAFIKLDFHCNQKCIFCCTSEDTQELTFQEAVELVDKYKKMGYRKIALSGGEPTLVPYLFDLIRMITAQGLKSKLQTNGILLDKEFCVRLKGTGLDSVLISVHSYLPEVHDQITQVAGSFEKTINGIRNLMGLGIDVELAYVITKQNLDVYDFFSFINNQFPKIKSVQLFVPWAIGRGMKNKGLIPRLGEVQPCLNKTLNEWAQFRITTRGIPLCYMKDHIKNSSEYCALTSRQKPMICNDYGTDQPKHSFEESNCKEPQCRLCSLFNKCGGTWNTYPKIYPNELFPVYEK